MNNLLVWSYIVNFMCNLIRPETREGNSWCSVHYIDLSIKNFSDGCNMDSSKLKR